MNGPRVIVGPKCKVGPETCCYLFSLSVLLLGCWNVFGGNCDFYKFIFALTLLAVVKEILLFFGVITLEKVFEVMPG